jgi:hypothetical protein
VNFAFAYTPDFVASLSSILAVQYCPQALAALALALAQQKRSVLVALPRIVAGRTLTVDEQTVVWRLIGAADCDRAPELETVFPSIADVAPTREQYAPLLRVEFARSLPVILGRVPPSHELAVTVSGVWFAAAKARPDLTAETPAVADLIFRLSQSEKLLFDMVSKVRRGRLETLPFAQYVRDVAVAARARGVRSGDAPYATFLLRIAGVLFSSVVVLRSAAHSAVAAIFGLEIPFRSAEGSPA